MKGLVLIPLRLEDGTLVGYAAISDAKYLPDPVRFSMRHRA
jgi:hypothetical protein